MLATRSVNHNRLMRCCALSSKSESQRYWEARGWMGKWRCQLSMFHRTFFHFTKWQTPKQCTLHSAI